MKYTEENFDPMTCSWDDLQSAIKHACARKADPSMLRRAGFLRGIALMRSSVAETERACLMMGKDPHACGWMEGVLHAKIVLAASGIAIK